jgi:DNA-binding XRE family transcriptional regulator
VEKHAESIGIIAADSRNEFDIGWLAGRRESVRISRFWLRRSSVFAEWERRKARDWKRTRHSSRLYPPLTNERELINDTYRPWTYQQQNWQIACIVTPIDVRVRFGRAVRTRRQKLGVSQEEFADMCGLDRTYMGGIERGERNLSLINIEKIARGFEITIGELFRGV